MQRCGILYTIPLAQLDMLVDYTSLNAAFDLGPLVLEVDDQGVDVEFSGLYRNVFRGKKHTEETKELQRQASTGENNPRYGVRLTEEERRSCHHGQDYNGDNNPNARTFIFTEPSGVEHIVVGKFRLFCLDNGLSTHTMRAAIDYDRQGPRKNGWSVRRLE